MNTVKGYEKLVAVYQDAHHQAAKGKGDERHANGQPFHGQRMQQISGLLRSSDGMAFQAIKKLTEGLQFEDHARREAELLGALNYIAGIVIYYRETVDLVGLPAARPTPPCEYTLEEVTRGVTLSEWAAYVAVDANGGVYEYSHAVSTNDEVWQRVREKSRLYEFNFRLINKVVPPINFKNCLFEVMK